MSPGRHLVVMPIARVTLDVPLVYPGEVIFYPPDWADLAVLNVAENRSDSRSLAEVSSAASGVDLGTIQKHALIAFPAEFDWTLVGRINHGAHLEFLRSLSEFADDSCLNLIRYRQCRIEPVDALPGRAGQTDSNHMMAAVLLFNAARLEGRIIAGAAFTHFITRGLGLPLEPMDEAHFPRDGDVGHIARHALSLYAALLEANNPTSKFIQALALLEFLADPHEYRKFEEVKKTIARYVARNNDEYLRLLDRFFELTGKKDPITQKVVGYRTRIIHIGERLDKLIPNPAERRKLFEELDGYIRPILDHMINHSELTFDAYLAVRDKMRPFQS